MTRPPLSTRRLLLMVLVVLASFLQSPNADACSCRPTKSVPQEVAASSAVFWGFVESIRLESDSSGRRPSIVSIRLRDGRMSERRVDYPKGSAEVRLSRTELEDKFRSCARRALGEPAVEQALGMLNGMESLDDVSRLSTLLMGDADGATA